MVKGRQLYCCTSYFLRHADRAAVKLSACVPQQAGNVSILVRDGYNTTQHGPKRHGAMREEHEKSLRLQKRRRRRTTRPPFVIGMCLHADAGEAPASMHWDSSKNNMACLPPGVRTAAEAVFLLEGQTASSAWRACGCIRLLFVCLRTPL